MSNPISHVDPDGLAIMEAYEKGGFAYHATMPTDALVKFRDAMKETEAHGFDRVCAEQWELGEKVRALLTGRGFESVGCCGKAPTRSLMARNVSKRSARWAPMMPI